MRIEWNGAEKLAQALYQKSQTEFIAVCKAGTTLLRNKARANTPVAKSTPWHTGGSLRHSLRMEMPSGNCTGVVGYTIHYAPHVEYGHRTRNGGYVQGQHFLQRAVEEAQPVFISNCKEALKK